MAAKKSKRAQAASGGGFGPVANGVLTSAAATVMALLLVAVLLRYCVIGQEAVPVINQVIKILGIMLAAIISVRRECKKPWARGGLAGLLYMITGTLAFCAATGDFSLDIANAADAGMGAAVGALAALITGKKSE